MADISKATDVRGYLYYFVMSLLLQERASNSHTCVDMERRICISNWIVKVW